MRLNVTPFSYMEHHAHIIFSTISYTLYLGTGLFRSSGRWRISQGPPWKMEQKQCKKSSNNFIAFLTITIPHFSKLHHLISLMIKVKEFSAPIIITKITGYQLHLFNFSCLLELSVILLHHKDHSPETTAHTCSSKILPPTVETTC